MMKKIKDNLFMVIMIIIIIFLVIFIIKTRKNNAEYINETETQIQEFTEQEEDGTKVNTSDKFGERKTLENLEFYNMSLTSKNGESYLTGRVKNTGSDRAGDEFIKITILDQNGIELNTITVYIGTINPGEEIILSNKISSNLVNAYDFIVSK